jgi:ABC-type multidrug transport system ATPase subunit
MNTLVGGNMIRGISGGQRRRLSVMEGLVPLRKVIMMDDVNIGLDSTTTYDVTRALKFVCKMAHTVIAVSMLQPQAEVFDLFDDVIFMESGQVLFHGPKDDLIPFFESFGFRKPPGVDPATFLSDLCNPGMIHLGVSSNSMM